MSTKTITKKNDLYSDFRANIDIHPNRGDILILSNEDAVIRSIRNILLTRKTERFGNIDFGAGLDSYLFEPISKITESMIKDSIIQAINNYEPRAELISVNVSARPDMNAYSATIVFGIINVIDPIRFDMLLKRVR